jgi:hypothetical protein
MYAIAGPLILFCYSTFALANGNIVITYNQRDGIAYLYDSQCPYSNLTNNYPYKFEMFKHGTNESMGVGCYNFIQTTKQFLFANNNDSSVVTVNLNEMQNSNKSWWQKFNEGIQQANQSNQQMQANRPPVVNLTPGITQGTPMQPNSLGGTFNGQVPMSPTNQGRNCTSTVSGNQIYTNCY